MRPESSRRKNTSATRGRSTRARAGDAFEGSDAVDLPALPQEIIDLILSHLDGNRTSLGQCSLVSHAWARSTAPHLFAQRRWPKCEHHWTRRRTVLNCSCASEKLEQGGLASLETFFEGSERVRHAVRDLHFRFALVRMSNRMSKLPIGCIAVDALLDVLSLLPNLRTLRMECINDHRAAAKDRSAGWAARKLEKLGIGYALHLDQYAFASIIGFFASITEVVIKETVVSLPEDPPYYPAMFATGSEKTRISSVTFNRCSTTSIAKYLGALAVVADVRSLAHLSISDLKEDGQSEDVVRCLGLFTQLDSFSYEVSLGQGAAGDCDWHTIQQVVSHCSARTVTLALIMHHTPPPDNLNSIRTILRDLDWAPIDIAAASSQRLEVLRLECRLALRVVEFEQGPLSEAVKSVLKSKLSPRVYSLLRVGS